jgi:hypothetical protein
MQPANKPSTRSDHETTYRRNCPLHRLRCICLRCRYSSHHASISTYDVYQSNGVIQVIDTVLMPMQAH